MDQKNIPEIEEFQLQGVRHMKREDANLNKKVFNWIVHKERKKRGKQILTWKEGILDSMGKNVRLRLNAAYIMEKKTPSLD